MSDGAQFEPGATVADRYVIERRLGAGGMGVVYAARDTRIERRVAIKAILGFQASAEARALLRIEAKAVGALAHPGVVTLFDFIEEADSLLLVMELVDGKSLRDRLNEGPTLGVDEVTKILVGVGAALQAAHDAGFVHRDVKPDNIMLRADGRTALLDFGIAKALSGPASVDPLGRTATGQIKGTPAYLAPEQVMGEAITPATDQFALGVVAYEMLAGQRPWPEDNLGALVAAITSGVRPSVSKLRPDARSKDATITRSLAKEPADRHPSVADFVIAFSAVVAPTVGAAGVSPVAKTVDPALQLALLDTEAAPIAPPQLRSRRVVPALVALVALVALAALTITVTGAAWKLLETRATDPGPMPSASSSSPRPSPHRFADVPLTPAANKAAEDEVREGLRLFSKASPKARVHFDKAIELDPASTSARLSRVLLDQVYLSLTSEREWRAIDPDEAHRDLRVALDSQAKMNARDRGLGDVLVELLHDPPDNEAALRAAVALEATAPDDPEVVLLHAMVENNLLHVSVAINLMRRVASLDEESTVGLWAAGVSLSDRRLSIPDVFDPATARKDAEACMKRDRTSMPCRSLLANALDELGECADLEPLGREMVALDPDAPNGYDVRALAAYVGHGDATALQMLLDESAKRSVYPADARVSASHMLNQFRLDLAADAQQYSASFDESRQEDIDTLELMLDTQAEMGDDKARARTAKNALARYEARRAPLAFWEDRTGQLLRVAWDGGLLSDSEFRERREKWLVGWKARTTRYDFELNAWNQLTGPDGLQLSPRLPPSELRETFALAERFGLEPPKKPWTSPVSNVATGRVLMAVGRLAQARPYIESGAMGCFVEPYAVLQLARLRTAEGNIAAACAAFAKVVEMRGHAIPRSVYAEQAKEEAETLHCAAR